MRTAYFWTASAAALAWCSQAGAQAAQSTQAQANNSTAAAAPQSSEIVITARRRAENLMRTPISGTVLTGTDLANKGVTTVDALQFAAPSITVNNFGQGNDFNIRGIGKGEHNTQTTTGVITYRDARRKKSHQSHGTANRPRLWGKHAVSAALDNPDRKVLRAWATREAADFMQFPKDLPVTFAEAPDLGRLVPHDAPHQGVVIEVEPIEDVWLDGLLTEAGERATLLVLDQVTDPHNVGAILRSAAAFGAIGIVTQDRHSPPESGVVAKAASGALERVPWARVVNLARALEEIGEAGFWRIGLTGDADTELKDALGPSRVALVLGAEGPGLRPNTREHCDALARLPISDAIESLNVSNAAAVALYAASIA